jgi:hypothetical protein
MCVTFGHSFVYRHCIVGRMFQTSRHLNIYIYIFCFSNAIGSCLSNTVDYFIISCVLNFTRVEAEIFVVSVFRNLLVDLILSCNFLMVGRVITVNNTTRSFQ